MTDVIIMDVMTEEMTDATIVIRADVMIKEITVQMVEIKMENPRMDAKK